MILEFNEPNVFIKIKHGADDQEIVTTLESNPRIYKILTSLANSEYLRGIEEGRRDAHCVNSAQEEKE